jgi:hypothetical protein
MDNEMNNTEWLEYYRNNPAVFDSFIDCIEKEITKKEQRIEELESALKEIIAMCLEHPAVYDGTVQIKNAQKVLSNDPT